MFVSLKMTQLIKIVMSYEAEEDEDSFTLAIATVDYDGYIELTSFIEDETILVNTLHEAADFINDSIDDKGLFVCH